METLPLEPTVRSSLPLAYRFADVVVEPRRRQVLRAGRSVHVEPKVFDLIVYLLANRDRVVLHETLLRDVWGGVVVAQTAITQCVAQARRVLGDSARTPRFIRTYHRLGYQFVARVAERRRGA